MQNQMIWPEAHSSFASCGRPKTSSIYRDPPRTRQRTLILAAFLPWGGSDDTVTRRTGPQHTRFCPARAAAKRHSSSPRDCPPRSYRGADRQRRGLAGNRNDAPPHTAPQATLVWRAPEGLAAVPAGGGGAWPGFETTRRAELAARTASGQATAQRHTQRPGPSSQATRRPEHQRHHR